MEEWHGRESLDDEWCIVKEWWIVEGWCIGGYF